MPGRSQRATGVYIKNIQKQQKISSQLPLYLAVHVQPPISRPPPALSVLQLQLGPGLVHAALLCLHGLRCMPGPQRCGNKHRFFTVADRCVWVCVFSVCVWYRKGTVVRRGTYLIGYPNLHCVYVCMHPCTHTHTHTHQNVVDICWCMCVFCGRIELGCVVGCVSPCIQTRLHLSTYTHYPIFIQHPHTHTHTHTHAHTSTQPMTHQFSPALPPKTPNANQCSFVTDNMSAVTQGRGQGKAACSGYAAFVGSIVFSGKNR